MTQPSPSKKSSLSEIAKRIRDNIPDTQPSPEDDLPPTLESLRSRLLSYRCSIAATTTDWLATLLDDTVSELDRLRAELAEMRQLLEAALADSIDYMDIVEDRDRLRAEKAELLKTINAIHDHTVDASKISHIEWLCRTALTKAKNDTEGK